MKLIVGLGNPGRRYSKTRHNIGFMILDKMVEKQKAAFSSDRYYQYLKTENTVYLKPTTFMNLSGIAVSKAIYKFDVTSLLVIYDDIYLPLGELRVREKGSAGGHKGVQSIINALGDLEFARMRVGIGSPGYEGLSEYVLKSFRREELAILEEVKDFSCQLIDEFIIGDYKEMIDYYSKNNKSYSEKIEQISESKTKGGKSE